MIMKHRSKIATLAALAAAVDVKFSLFDALYDAGAGGKQEKIRKPGVDQRRIGRPMGSAYAEVHS
jgi:hypothetical protein